MATKFSVRFDLDFTEDIAPDLVAVLVSDLLDSEEVDHTLVEVTPYTTWEDGDEI